MTRDEVLDEALVVVQREVQAATGLRWDANARGRASAAAYIRQEIANLKSKPPEKSPEVLCSWCSHHRDRERHFAALLDVADGGQYRNDWDARIETLVAERDSLKAQFSQERAESTARIEGLEAERDRYREALALKRWTEDGAPMKGETP